MNPPRGLPALARLAARSAACTATMRARGITTTGLVRCDGLLPALHTGGTVRLGAQLSLRAVTGRVELGAHPGGTLTIGDRVFVNQGASIVATTSIEIGDDVHVGDLVGIADTDHHAVDHLTAVRTAPVVVEHHAWIGRAATLLPGAHVGAHAVIGAGAVVTGAIPPGVLALGVPARPVRDLAPARPGWRRA
ncbi:acyltransferase [Actinomycetospora termitidis]|uniref:Acyltransferase n=1 Tax=Actinomycetospora termitidis TaxID=3053470 RepID=A0ABT7MFU7_9PSEU|nr:acyltransferase [Actinomycetospora sp. Odt1-22]MDL5159546.1 acyltransferase [Actinomycetospora sp. Odt1-22]